MTLRGDGETEDELVDAWDGQIDVLVVDALLAEVDGMTLVA
jgi:hypothetical protein